MLSSIGISFEAPSALRRRIMQAVRRKHTAPELAVRSLLHRMGYRFTLHREGLAGKPDIVLPRHHSVVLVHGCFWHGHTCRRGVKVPGTNSEYWRAKVVRNRLRDRRNARALRAEGWKVLVVWECQVRKEEKLKAKIQTLLRPGRPGRHRRRV